MAYCTVDDLNDYASYIDITEFTDPSTTQVQRMIADVDTEIDQKLQAVGVLVPVTDTDPLRIVKRLSIHGTLAEYYRAISMESDRATMYQKLYDEKMREIMKTPAIITAGGTSTLGTIGGSGRPSSEAPAFERGGGQW